MDHDDAAVLSDFDDDISDIEEENSIHESDEENVSTNDEKLEPNDALKTSPYMTKYEKAKIIGLRVNQINNNSPIMINVDTSRLSSFEIAERELMEKKIDFKIRRFLPFGKFEDWSVKDLIIR